MASSSSYFTQQTPLYPRYEVAGRDPLDASPWHHDAEEQHYEERRRWAKHPDIVVHKPLQRNMSFESAPSPTPPRLPTIDVALAAKRAILKTQNDEGLKNEEPPKIVGKKRQRYLRDVDRRSIIQRIDNGEKQADLAREFGVTRAAICHIKKNRNEIVSRYESLVASAKEFERSTNSKQQSEVAEAVHELTQPSVQLLLTTLRDATTSPRSYRPSAKRLMTLLLEEAIASATTVASTVCTTTGQTIRGAKTTTSPLCCVGVGEKGWPLVELYRHIEPYGHIGGIDLTTTTNGPIVDGLHLPRDVQAGARILLLSVSSATGESLCACVHALQRVGVAPAEIQIAVLVCTMKGVTQVTKQFPGVRILTCAVEMSLSPTTTLTDFLDRYDGIKRESVALDSWHDSSRRWVASTAHGHES